MNKEKRKERYLKNKNKDITHKKEAWDEGKLIKPEGGVLDYWEPQYLEELGKRLVQTLSSTTEDNCLQIFQLYRIKVRDYLLHYPPELEKSSDYVYLKNLIETYWDNKEKLYEASRTL